jgi:hypothetical protein
MLHANVSERDIGGRSTALRWGRFGFWLQNLKVTAAEKDCPNLSAGADCPEWLSIQTDFKRSRIARQKFRVALNLKLVGFGRLKCSDKYSLPSGRQGYPGGLGGS